MIDPTDWFDTPKSILLAVLRVLWWLAWDVCVQTVGWSIGWCVLRVLTLGRYPEERLGGVDCSTPAVRALVFCLCDAASVQLYGVYPRV